MNKRLLVFVSILAFFTACKKDPPKIPDANQRPDVSPVPTSFSQNFLIEKYTSSSAGRAPLADFYSDSLMRNNPGRVFAAAIHLNDQMMDSTLLNPYTLRHELDSFWNPGSIYPFGMVNRYFDEATATGPGGWGNHVMIYSGARPQCGVALEAKDISAGILDLTVHVGFAENLFGDYRLHGYVIENTVQSNDPLYGQLNDFSSEGSTPDPNLPYYQLNDTISQYAYGQVVRKVFTVNKVKGDIIPQGIMRRGAEHVTGYRINLNGINTSNAYILVFVDKYGDTPSGRRIINVQRVSIGASQDWN